MWTLWLFVYPCSGCFSSPSGYGCWLCTHLLFKLFWHCTACDTCDIATQLVTLVSLPHSMWHLWHWHPTCDTCDIDIQHVTLVTLTLTMWHLWHWHSPCDTCDIGIQRVTHNMWHLWHWHPTLTFDKLIKCILIYKTHGCSIYAIYCHTLVLHFL